MRAAILAQALELCVSKMPVPFQIWNWNDLPDVWKRPLDPVQLRAAAESVGYAPEKVGTRVGVECTDSPLAAIYQAHIIVHDAANPDAASLCGALVNSVDLERQYGAVTAQRTNVELAVTGRPALRPVWV